MGWNLYLVPFKRGESEPIPFAEAASVLERYGTLSEGHGELELAPKSTAEIGSRVTIDCSGAVVRFVTIERPRDTPIFRAFVFDLLTKLRMTAIEPSGGPVMIADDFDVADLPQVYQTNFQRFSSEAALLNP
jgi:hypothetical protein